MSTEERRLAGRYVLDAPIGRGGMGEVWRATDTVLGRQVAIKMIDLSRVPDEAGAIRFEREARATAGLSHPHVVTVHDTGVEGDTAYLVMELLPGPSLAERLADGPLPVEDVVDIGRQVASALEAAHARGLVHRDIKPANLVRAADGRIRVVDFGITQLAEAAGQQALTATHTVMGTAEYLAPEQAMGGRVDGRADLYALGCVLFALLTGRPPFSGPTAVATMMQHTNDAVPDVRTLRPDTPAWLAALVTGLLAKSPQDRPAGAGAVVEALDARTAPAGAADATTVLPVGGADPTQRLAAAPFPPVTAPPTSPPPPPSTRSDRHEERRGSSAPLWVLAVVAVLAVALLAWYLLSGLGSGADPAATPSATPTASSEAPTTSEPAPSTSAPEPTPTPSENPTAADPGQPVSDAASALRDEVSALDAAGGIDPKAAETLQKELADIDDALAAQDTKALVKARDKMLEQYGKNVDDGSIPPEAASRLNPLVQDLADAVDAYDASQG